ncbi:MULTISPECIES: Flp family type IVb pilin [unclassified Rhizobium]|uniref:Flp family type IVb pilin n=1 Tax=unclassified Rhizobium TaxID=2613769 RepID=UPI000BCB04FC|nr:MULTISPECIES: Flp family type IVb pilin [unclassified Rhizobium]MDH7806945.1 pilus assembly protein Flp/PilA [Rhizobium sp. AN67]MDQ4408214.1 Flp family type IVb pilin [Rhizobium sp. AN63]SOD57521.1 pilus assembly protein Flp/PilA [Rhizobium sp. AN6A]
MTKIFARFLKDESGATAIEYGLIAALISVAIIGGATTLGGQLKDTFAFIAKKFTDSKAATGGV